MILSKEFYFNDTVDVSKALLGKVLHINLGDEEKRARIVEVEAYIGIDDPASHAFKDKRTPRIKSMYLHGGHSYIYLIYGMLLLSELRHKR